MFTLTATALLFFTSAAGATELLVNPDGSGNYRTIQACADAAKPGDTCLVSSGVYDEHITTKVGGTSDEERLTFRGHGGVTLRGFDVRHPYVTIEGFDITGGSLVPGYITIRDGGDNCRILDNTVRNGATNIYGVYFYATHGESASGCLVRGNRLSNLNGHFLVITGDNHVFERNVLEYQNNRDYIRLFGSHHVFRRNTFWRGTVSLGTGNHPDFVQTFAGPNSRSENHLFEENWVQDLPSQFSQVISGDGVAADIPLRDNVKNITFRRNVIVGVSANANISMPGVRFENNTFYRMSYELSGINYSGSLRRGDGSRGTLRNNVFLAGGSRATQLDDTSGFYAFGGASFSREVIAIFVTRETDTSGNLIYDGPITVGVFNDLKSAGYIDGNGKILGPARALTDISQFVLAAQYAGYKSALYDSLLKTVLLDQSMRTTFSADYNFVAGSPAAGFPAKRERGCDYTTTFTDWNFCEAHGINGGDPRFPNLENPLGPDGVPFTLDDGLKPLPTSPLCGKGEGGTDIGAYSCDPTKVFPIDPPPAPTNLRIVR